MELFFQCQLFQTLIHINQPARRILPKTRGNPTLKVHQITILDIKVEIMIASKAIQKEQGQTFDNFAIKTEIQFFFSISVLLKSYFFNA